MIKEHLNLILTENSKFKTQFQNLKNSAESEKEWLTLKISQQSQQIFDFEKKDSFLNHQIETLKQRIHQKQDKIEQMQDQISKKEVML